MSTLSFVAKLLWNQWTFTPPYPTNSFAGQTVIITGANVGLGFEAARHITRLGAVKVIIACRSIEKGEAAKKDIEKSTKRTGVVEVWQLDLCSYESVKAFAAKANALPRLDVLLENAGVATNKYATAEDNETTITTNVVSTMLLALLLLPKLRETATKFNVHPHLVIVSSEVHFFTNIAAERDDAGGSIFAALNDKSKARMGDRYNASKLLEVLAVRALVAEHAPAGYPVIVNYMNPGFCHSSLMREVGWVQFVLKGIMGARTTEVGSRTLVSSASFSADSHGQYMSDSRISEPSPFVRSEEGAKTQKRVWAELKERLERIEPGIMGNF
jgi:NAD(P)-dependent dehydrogenase (short-subunit alcohol dehydrogenase family)